MKKVLSIDGGGVRGIIPACILAEIEQRTQKKISSLFDCITGTSTGGLIALALAKSNQVSDPITAANLVNIYLEQSKHIFSSSLLRKIYTGFGLWGSKYSRANYDAILHVIFNREWLSDTLCNVFIPVYDVNHEQPIVLNSALALLNQRNNFYLKDIAAAASAAPVYFPPDRFTSLDDKRQITAVDGALFTNNPALIGVTAAYTLFPAVEKKELFLLSLGTGSVHSQQTPFNDGYIGWLKDEYLLTKMMDAEVAFSEIVAKHLLDEQNNVRIQVETDQKNSALDNGSVKNLYQLQTVAQTFIDNNKKLIDHICSILVG